MTIADWDTAATAGYYEAFCRRHARYDDANRALVANASLERGQRVLDFAAGTGRTAEAVLTYLGPQDEVVCVEPASAMRMAGAARLRDPRVRWVADCPAGDHRFARVLCGAALWQLRPLGAIVERLAGLVATGGALCFNIPGSYLGIPDEPGGGPNPWLLELPARLIEGCEPVLDRVDPLPAPDEIDALLDRAGLTPRRWSVRSRLTQVAYRDWLKVPPMTAGWLAGLAANERARRIDRAFEAVDPDSWRWELWLGWTAWRN